MSVVGGGMFPWWPAGSGVGMKGWPRFSAEQPAGFGDDAANAVEPFADEDTCLKLQVGGNELRQCRTIARTEVELRGQGAWIRGKRIAHRPVTQQTSKRGDEINCDHGYVPVWRFLIPVPAWQENHRHVPK